VLLKIGEKGGVSFLELLVEMFSGEFWTRSFPLFFAAC
jgi:hypothetical protein